MTWHYRSQHESLITYSNYRFYDGDLHTFPGAVDVAADVGVELFKVDGVYRRGGARDNPVEAKKIVERVLHHRRTNPTLSIGVIAFSSAQEDAIERELLRASEQFPELLALSNDDRLEGFFVKNLENVQGDERDIILFSVGYGPDEHGKFTLNMGPLNKEGGWRRLNVAITRARRRVEVITSVLAEDFPNEQASAGIKHLKGYLDFARRGVAALALDLQGSMGDVDSPFEAEVLLTLQRMGFDAVPQVGVAGYRVDLAVRDDTRPGTYILGIECDGATYHSSKVARDRDRLRQEVLEGLGWQIFRIWGPSWYRDRANQENRLRNAVEAAQRGRVPAQIRRDVVGVASPVVEILDVDLNASPDWTQPYVPACVRAPRTSAAMHEPEARSELRRVIADVVRQEGPVHEDRVLLVVRDAWGNGRSGPRMREAFDNALRDLRGELQRDPRGVLSLRGSAVSVVRIPTADPATKRDAEQVPREECLLAITLLVNDARAIVPDELAVRVARLFGWKRVGPDIRAMMIETVLEAVNRKVIQSDGENLVPVNQK